MARVILAGVGSLGRLVLGALAGDARFVVAGLVDPALAGKTVRGHTARGTLAEALEATGPADVLLQVTVSKAAEAAPQILEALGRGLAVVSSCEELHGIGLVPGAADKAAIDRAARKAGCAVIAAGVNPGWIMDAVPVHLARAVRNVRAVRIERVVDLGRRRTALRRKIGVGLSRREFASRRGGGHVGLGLSARIVHAGIWGGGDPVDLVETRAPILRAGRIVGVRERAVVGAGRKARVTLDLRMQMGARPERDAISIDGDPALRCVFSGGVGGDAATVALLLAGAAEARAAAPGLQSLALTSIAARDT